MTTYQLSQLHQLVQQVRWDLESLENLREKSNIMYFEREIGAIKEKITEAKKVYFENTKSYGFGRGGIRRYVCIIYIRLIYGKCVIVYCACICDLVAMQTLYIYIYVCVYVRLKNENKQTCQSCWTNGALIALGTRTTYSARRALERNKK